MNDIDDLRQRVDALDNLLWKIAERLDEITTKIDEIAERHRARDASADWWKLGPDDGGADS